MNTSHFILAFLVSALVTFIACSYDPGPLQDFCVATDDHKKTLFVNGEFCKDPKDVTSNDFVFKGLNVPANTDNEMGYNITFVNDETFPGLNTLGMSMSRIDYAPYGLNPPHYHPRSSEILLVTLGTLFVGFVTSNKDGNRLFAKVLYEGDAFVAPMGMIHFQLNIRHTPAVAFVAFGSQSPGLVTVANAVFGSDPPIKREVLAKAFMLDEDLVEILRKKFRGMN